VIAEALYQLSSRSHIALPWARDPFSTFGCSQGRSQVSMMWGLVSRSGSIRSFSTLMGLLICLDCPDSGVKDWDSDIQWVWLIHPIEKFQVQQC